jgi:hypothetical protein
MSTCGTIAKTVAPTKGADCNGDKTVGTGNICCMVTAKMNTTNIVGCMSGPNTPDMSGLITQGATIGVNSIKFDCASTYMGVSMLIAVIAFFLF